MQNFIPYCITYFPSHTLFHTPFHISIHFTTHLAYKHTISLIAIKPFYYPPYHTKILPHSMYYTMLQYIFYSPPYTVYILHFAFDPIYTLFHTPLLLIPYYIHRYTFYSIPYSIPYSTSNHTPCKSHILNHHYGTVLVSWTTCKKLALICATEDI